MNGLQEKLQAEADARDQELRSRFPVDRCLSCGTAGTDGLRLVEFQWRKQVGRSAHSWVRVEHVSQHVLCPVCLAQVLSRRPWFWVMRYIAGIAFAVSICGLVACPVVLWYMNLSRSERNEAIDALMATAGFLPVALFVQWLARRCSVPGPLVNMTGRGWECRTVREIHTGD